MSKKSEIIAELENIPENLLEDVLDYINFLKSKINRQKIATALASESILKKDWLLPEEDEAWRDL
jgi:hypothetical protein